MVITCLVFLSMAIYFCYQHRAFFRRATTTPVGGGAAAHGWPLRDDPYMTARRTTIADLLAQRNMRLRAQLLAPLHHPYCPSLFLRGRRRRRGGA